MAFSCKIVLGDYAKRDKSHLVYLQAIIDGKKASVSLGFYVDEDSFDEKRQCMKKNHANAKDYDAEFLRAKAKANSIASKYRQDEKTLTPEIFRNEFTTPPEKIDLIRFITTEIELKRPTLAKNTYKQHVTVINKLTAFKKRIDFGDIGIELGQKFENYLRKPVLKKSGPKTMKESTIAKLLKILKLYLRDARNKGFKFDDPQIKTKIFKSNRLGLTQIEVDKLDAYYRSQDCKPSHKKVLRCFLFSCYTGLRISDIKVISWNNVHDDLLIFLPEKTKGKQNTVTMPLTEIDKSYLPDRRDSGPIFETFADQTCNRILKKIAKVVGINKVLTYHTSRHTFGSLFAEGGNIVALQQMMGHSDIKTTMGYVHTSTKNLVDAKNKRFGKRGKDSGQNESI